MLKKYILNNIKSYDYSLIFVFILLTLFGIVMVYSASMVTAIELYQTNDSSYFYKRQVIFVLAGFVAMLISAFLPYKMYKTNGFLGLIIFSSIATLIALDFFGKTSNNATSWFRFGPFSLQPSEFVKLGVIVYLAAVYAKKQHYLDNFNRGVIPPIIFLGITCFLIALQPDIGTAGITLLTGMIVIFCSGISWKTITRLILIGVGFIAILSPFIISNLDSILTEKRLGRLYSFIDPFQYASNEGHQLVNSYLAIGQSGWFGVGLGKSIQKLGYLPEAHTDFIMAIIAEELGVLGVAFVIGALCFIVLKGIHIGMKCHDPFGSLLAFGISGLIGIQTCINLGGVSGLIPITGVTLPFISYGGSSLISLSIAIGLLLNVSAFTNFHHKKQEEKNKDEMKKPVSKNRKLYSI